VEVEEGGKGGWCDGGDRIVLDVEDLEALEGGEEVGIQGGKTIVTEVKGYEFREARKCLVGEKVGGEGVTGEV